MGKENIYLRKKEFMIKDLINVRKWKKIQENFSTIVDSNIRIVDPEGKLLTSASREPRLCREILKESVHGELLCGNCLPKFLGGEAIVDKNLSFYCLGGLCSFISPLRVYDSAVLGYVIVGPLILVSRKQKEEYRQIAEEFNVDLEDFWSAVLEIKVMSFQGAKSLVQLVKDIVEYTLNLSYRDLIRQKETMMGNVSSKLKSLLDVLLSVAFEVSGADVGSIMLLDDKREAMKILASRGIADEIVRNTKVRLGEGISGIALRERESFLIEDKKVDNRIKPYLSRPYISSSMVLPLKIEDEVMGVINLGTLQTSQVRFNKDKFSLVNRLVDLVTTAIRT